MKCNKKNCPLVGNNENCDIRDCKWRTEDASDNELIRRSDAINSVLGITMLQGRVPMDTVIYQITSIPAVEPCTDAISREELFRTFVEDNSIGHYGEFMDGSDCAFTEREVLKTIKDAPSVIVEPKAESIIEACVLETATREAYEEGMADAWKIAQTVFASEVTLYEAMDVAKCMKGTGDDY